MVYFITANSFKTELLTQFSKLKKLIFKNSKFKEEEDEFKMAIFFSRILNTRELRRLLRTIYRS